MINCPRVESIMRVRSSKQHESKLASQFEWHQLRDKITESTSHWYANVNGRCWTRERGTERVRKLVSQFYRPDNRTLIRLLCRASSTIWLSSFAARETRIFMGTWRETNGDMLRTDTSHYQETEAIVWLLTITYKRFGSSQLAAKCQNYHKRIFCCALYFYVSVFVGSPANDTTFRLTSLPLSKPMTSVSARDN